MSFISLPKYIQGHRNLEEKSGESLLGITNGTTKPQEGWKT